MPWANLLKKLADAGAKTHASFSAKCPRCPEKDVLTGSADAQPNDVSVVNCAPPDVSHGKTRAPSRRRDLMSLADSIAPIEPLTITSIFRPARDVERASMDKSALITAERVGL
jgi:hypothetical protein